MTSNELIKRCIIVGSALTIAVAVVFSVWLESVSSTPLIITPVLFTVASVLTVKILTMPTAEALLKFSSAFMLTNVLKLVAFLIFFVVSYLQMEGEKRIGFVVVFMVLYLVFLVLDTMTLLQYYKDKEKS
jgi:F0F1-type ATP synthase assembly protein I